MNNFELDRELRETLHECADSVVPNDTLKSRIDLTLSAAPRRKRYLSRRIALGVAAAVCLTMAGALARGPIASLVTGTKIADIRTNLEELRSDAATIADEITIPSNISDYKFQEGSLDTTNKMDDSGNHLGSYASVHADYKNMENGLAFTVRLWDSELDSDDTLPDLTRDFNDLTISYTNDAYIFLPEGEAPTPEELAKEKAGDLFLSYGSDTREEKQFQNVTWRSGDLVYSLFSSDTIWTADSLFAAAEELISAK